MINNPLTLTDELKILDNKIKANQAQYDLDREATKISALSSKVFDLWELGFKAGVVEQAKFEYSPLGKVFNNGKRKRRQKRSTFEKVKKYWR